MRYITTTLHSFARWLLMWTVRRNSYYVAEAYPQMSGILADYLTVYKEKRWADFYVEGKVPPLTDDDWDTSGWSDAVDELLDNIIRTFRKLEKGESTPEVDAALTRWAELREAEHDSDFVPTENENFHRLRGNDEYSPAVAEAWDELKRLEAIEEEEVQAALADFARYFQYFWS